MKLPKEYFVVTQILYWKTSSILMVKFLALITFSLGRGCGPAKDLRTGINFKKASPLFGLILHNKKHLLDTETLDSNFDIER